MAEQPLCDVVFADRYAMPAETSRQQLFDRVAQALALAEPAATREPVARQFVRNLRHGAFGAGRIMANAGGPPNQTMVNCFVHPVAAPASAPHEAPDLDRALDEARLTLSMGGGVGYDFSDIPPATALRDSGATSERGVCAAIDRFDRMCSEVGATGTRRGAQMAVLRCDHPDLLAFVGAKRGRSRWPTFNLSVAVTDAFMNAVADDQPWTLRHRAPPPGASGSPPAAPDGRQDYATLPARRIWHEIVTQARDSAEPGLLFIDTINAANPLRFRETLAATNPCGEQPLPPYGSCVLGPIDLSRLVRHPFGVDGEPRFDFSALAAAVEIQVRLLDNVLDLTHWPLAAHAREARATRRIGVGVTALGDALTMMKLRYDAPAARELAGRIARHMRDHAYAASARLAGERGAYPCCDPAVHLDGRTGAPPLPGAVRAAIERAGLRNSHLLSFAPTGSVSIAFGGNCSNGVEPAYDWICQRKVRLGDGETHSLRAENRAHRRFRELCGDRTPLPDYFTRAVDVAPPDHVAMLAALQPYVDAAISKTVTVGSACTLSQIDALFFTAWRSKLKGVTVFRPDASLDAVLVAVEAGACASSPCVNC
ncbi:ribonucleotide reductase-like protein [Burkholderia lata]|uniref:adenosylcobalamin-dependent ribonucleoside-diphosphate reductase n=1 Tax=Burkholderia lata (strain ATCC 17760 / DSM 23089 / LMG 22485 / NCIMB 9086 / R18194 / 383) TaxID=482957 RepID=UPI0014533225|nr:adenosylcobalamin-dependent ribonucleoside-diphosphate reductase [Burkholderia lata]VWC68318.1 ribonucleotide reductase-like protein [Burkholderia lata]